MFGSPAYAFTDKKMEHLRHKGFEDDPNGGQHLSNGFPVPYRRKDLGHFSVSPPSGVERRAHALRIRFPGGAPYQLGRPRQFSGNTASSEPLLRAGSPAPRGDGLRATDVPEHHNDARLHVAGGGGPARSLSIDASRPVHSRRQSAPSLSVSASTTGTLTPLSAGRRFDRSGRLSTYGHGRTGPGTPSMAPRHRIGQMERLMTNHATGNPRQERRVSYGIQRRVGICSRCSTRPSVAVRCIPHKAPAKESRRATPFPM